MWWINSDFNTKEEQRLFPLANVFLFVRLARSLWALELALVMMLMKSPFCQSASHGAGECAGNYPSFQYAFTHST